MDTNTGLKIGLSLCCILPSAPLGYFCHPDPHKRYRLVGRGGAQPALSQGCWGQPWSPAWGLLRQDPVWRMWRSKPFTSALQIRRCPSRRRWLGHVPQAPALLLRSGLPPAPLVPSQGLSCLCQPLPPLGGSQWAGIDCSAPSPLSKEEDEAQQSKYRPAEQRRRRREG